ncbi:hypothetical protein EJB05_09195, partial [Eragrostis curvula]
MALSFNRSITFPLSPARSFNARRHVLSISVSSSRTHPLLAHLQNTVQAVHSWIAEPAAAASWGLAYLDALHATLGKLFLLPEARTALRHRRLPPRRLPRPRRRERRLPGGCGRPQSPCATPRWPQIGAAAIVADEVSGVLAKTSVTQAAREGHELLNRATCRRASNTPQATAE